MTHWANLAEWRSHGKNSAFSNGQPADVSAGKLPKGKGVAELQYESMMDNKVNFYEMP
jgi:hypothetical protein